MAQACIFSQGMLGKAPEEDDPNMADLKPVCNQELSSLLSDELGPCLMIFLWSSTKCSQFKCKGVIQWEVEFDCRGQITKNTASGHETQYVIEVAEMKKSVNDSNRNKQLVLRLSLLQNTLKVALGASNLVLKGYIFFRYGAVQSSYRLVLLEILEKDNLYPILLIKMRVKRGEKLVLDHSQRMT